MRREKWKLQRGYYLYGQPIPLLIQLWDNETAVYDEEYQLYSKTFVVLDGFWDSALAYRNKCESIEKYNENRTGWHPRHPVFTAITQVLAIFVYHRCFDIR